MPLFVCPSPSLAPLAQALGFSLRTDKSTISPTPTAVLRAWAEGAREAVCPVATHEDLWALRPLALFAASFGVPLRSGTFREGLPARGGLRASEWRTAQEGALLFVWNPAEASVIGSVFPAFENQTLASGEVRIWAHDFPLGLSETYLGAYAGLVKSELALLTAHIRPDPFSGARVFVMGKPGERGEVALFNAGPGEVVEVFFSDTPAVFAVGVSQVIAVPEALAPHLWVLNETTWIGPEWRLDPEGSLHQQATQAKVALIGGDEEPRSAQLRFEGSAPESVWLNGVPITGSDITLLPGENQLMVRGEHGPVFIVPDGACYLMELTQWAAQSSQ